jgi:hypothetical protein
MGQIDKGLLVVRPWQIGTPCGGIRYNVARGSDPDHLLRTAHYSDC